MIPAFQPKEKLEKTNRKLDLSQYRCQEEAYFKTGLSVSTITAEQACENRGHKCLDLYAADQKTADKPSDKVPHDCTKYSNPRGVLSPGIMVRLPLPSRLCL